MPIQNTSQEDQEYLCVLKTLNSLHYNIGKNLLADFLSGHKTPKIAGLRLDREPYFGCIGAMDRSSVMDLVEGMIMEGYIDQKPLNHNKFAKVLVCTEKGKSEINDPKRMHIRDTLSFGLNGISDSIEKLDKKDRERFSHMGGILEGLSPEQMKCVTDPTDHILCIAGAGSGKTRCLTRRIEFLARYRSVPQKKILAITFTRKARHEMKKRLEELIPANQIRVETFNSFAEKELRKYGSLIYNKEYRVMNLREKIRMIRSISQKAGTDPESLIKIYFPPLKLKQKDMSSLLITLINDISSILDYYAFSGKDISEFKKTESSLSSYHEKLKARELYRIIKEIPDYKKMHGFRDFTDQIVHLLRIYRKHPEVMPDFSHILVDEYQDVNDLQIELIRLLSPNSLFVVGDPRQSIYGWRGSNLKHLIQFKDAFPDCKVLELVSNYRSGKKIVDFFNSVISNMKLPDLSIANKLESAVRVTRYKDENQEALAVAEDIQKQDVKRKEIFVLARTNKEIEKIADVLRRNDIGFMKRTIEEMRSVSDQKEDQVLLSTVHAIKGLEAEIVYMIGVNANSYPCIVSENPIIDTIKAEDDYDKFAEELRLLYVGLSRARKKLFISHTKTLSNYIPEDALKQVGIVKEKDNTLKASPRITRVQKRQNDLAATHSRIYSELKEYRLETARSLGLRAYHIFTDKTLTDLCEQLPMTHIELENIYGMGPSKIMRFGKNIIEIIRRNA
jgi:superfamily I DNA/RNA helicase